MVSDYNQITRDNIRRRGEEFDDIGRLLSEQLYSDRTHFIYELLQNAEDALERRFHQYPKSTLPCSVQFRLYKDRLEFRHFGQTFNTEDVRAISDVLRGTKSENINQIGKFGIGFKSVYAFTSSPEIYSSDEHFIIERYIRPRKAERVLERREGETLFIFPFNHDQVFPEESFQIISEKLKRIGARVLLFLNRINKIEWQVNGQTEGTYLKDVKLKNSARRVMIIGQNGNQRDKEDWLLFERSVSRSGCDDTLKVEIAFRLECDEKTGQDKIIKTKESPLVVSFPTEKDTRFGFLIQGPYRTTPSRDNIPKDDKENRNLVKETATLVVDTLKELKDMNMLTVSLLEALPIRPSDYPNDGMFQPIVEAVQSALGSQSLLPTDDGGFVPAQQAKLASADWLRVLLSKIQLQSLLQSIEPLEWISEDITERRTNDIWKYLREQLRVEVVTPDSFARKITSEFLERQTDEWMIQFYSSLSLAPSTWNSQGPLRNKPFIRLEGDQHVPPFRDDGSPNVYLLTEGESDFPTVKQKLADSEQARYFLKEELRIPEPDMVDEVMERILPKYGQKEVPMISEDEHRSDISKILIALKTDSHSKKERINKCLKKTQFLQAKNSSSGEVAYKKPDEFYFRSSDLEIFFLDNPDTWFLNEGEGKNEWLNLGVEDKPRYLDFAIELPWDIKNRLRNNGGCTREISIVDYSLDGLEHFLNKIIDENEPQLKIKYARILWDFLLKHLNVLSEWQKRDFLKGVYRWFYRKDRFEHFDAAWLKLVRDYAWLPSKDGIFNKPNEISIEQLPSDFTRDKFLAEAMGFKSDEVDEVIILARKVGIEREDIDLLKALKENPEKYQRVKDIVSSTTHQRPDFPIKKGPYPERREEKIIEGLDNDSPIDYEPKTRIVRTSKGSIDPSTWLRGLYTNDDGKMVCQICQNEMPFKMFDGNYYFETVEIFEKKFRGSHGLDTEKEEFHLALCPLCAAMYKVFIKCENDNGAMHEIKSKLEDLEEFEIAIRLGELESTIRFVEDHFNDLKTILKKKTWDKMDNLEA